MDIDNACNLVRLEILHAQYRFPPMASAHEGYAVILEEVEELWKEIKNDKQPDIDRINSMRHEAMQVAAMGTRFLIDILP